MTPDQKKLVEVEKALKELKKRKTENRLSFYTPYPKQKDFHELGKTKRERLLMAGNQLGKTYSGGAEMAFHLTGLYPDWWDGRRYDRPIRAWASGVTSESTRDTVQRILLGPLGQHGSGAIPKQNIISVRTSRGIPDAIDTALIKHEPTGMLSQLSFKSYERGREKWQGETLDCIWFDEEPSQEIYSEGLARIAATAGFCYMTFTPLQGRSQVVNRFLSESSPDRGVIVMSIDDAEHITAEEKERIIAGYPLHEREARVKGVPMLGSGRIFPVAEEKIVVDPFRLPDHWARIVGIDFGYDHPFCAVFIAWDRDTDTAYVTDLIKVREETTPLHAAAIRAKGADWIPVAWPHDGLQSEKSTGETLASQYRKQGLNMLGSHAKFQDGGNSVEAGLMLMLERMQTGRLKVFSHLAGWLEEYRLYHRKDGRVVKEMDDALDATRYGLMMLRYAKSQPDFARGKVRVADNVNYNLFGEDESDPGAQKGFKFRFGGVAWGNPSRESLGLDTGEKRKIAIVQDINYPFFDEN